MTNVSRIAAAALLGLFPAAAPAQQTIPADRAHSISGRLEASDPTIEEQGHHDDYRISLRADQRVLISIESDEIDPMVFVYDARDTHEPVAENDDHGESLNSRLSFAAPENGDYLVRVQSFEPGDTGAYALRVEPLAPLPPPVTAHSGTATSSWRTFEGRLSADDPEIDGMHFDDYLVPLRQGQQLLVRLDSSEFDPMIRIVTASGRNGPEIDADDDAGPGTNSLLGFEAPQSDNYIVRVTSFGPGAVGAYRLQVSN